VSVKAKLCGSVCVNNDRNIFELVCQCGPKFAGACVSVRKETCRSWCVSEKRNL